jgi:sigma-B regulation protein RsbU (phosphoserine phosphatase)
MNAQPYRYLRTKLDRVAPTSRLGKFTLYLFVVDLFLYVLQKSLQLAAPSAATASGLNGWVVLLTGALIVLGTILFLRWFRYTVMWPLRNRLIVTYVFIGVIPVLLVVAMALGTAYLFSGQFATYLVTSDLQSELKSLSAFNSSVKVELAGSLRRGRAAPGTFEGFRPDDPRLARVRITAWYRGKELPIHEPPGTKPVEPPAWAQQDFTGVVLDNDALYLRAVDSVPVGDNKLVVISGTPLDRAQLERLATETGEITIYLTNPATKQASGNTNQLPIEVGEESAAPAGKRPSVRAERRASGSITSVSGGRLAESGSMLDRKIQFAAPFQVVRWDTGKNTSPSAILYVSTRVSLLYARLFARVGQFGRVVEAVLAGIAIFFAVIELLAFVIGIGLTRTITRSVAELYRATQHINRGDLKHRIAVRSRDQLAALEGSFNSMTESLQKLIAEQKEKERLESELAIAQEVQAQLFPKGTSDLESLEVHGICQPARTVSGDYYDFLPLGPDRLGIAVGDISGKGISAALLMATVHSAVRAYEFGRVPVTAGHLVVAGADGPTHSFAVRSAAPEAEFSPANVLSLLNRQLYRSTPAEKYATMFLGIYDGHARTLTYSNAGHLPPVIIGDDGGVRRLDTPGLVIGLFDSQGYEERNVELRVGDILLAFSDGITEPENEFGEFGEARLIDIVRQNRHLALARVSELVTAAVADWIGANEQPDDVTLVLARAR